MRLIFNKSNKFKSNIKKFTLCCFSRNCSSVRRSSIGMPQCSLINLAASNSAIWNKALVSSIRVVMLHNVFTHRLHLVFRSGMLSSGFADDDPSIRSHALHQFELLIDEQPLQNNPSNWNCLHQIICSDEVSTH